MSTLISIAFQSLFTSGVHSITAYLNQNDWLSATQSCHHWYGAAQVKSPHRDIALSLSTRTYHLLRACFSSSLKHHLTSLSLLARYPYSKNLSTRQCRLTIRQLNTIMSNLPHLTTFEANIDFTVSENEQTWKKKWEAKKTRRKARKEKIQGTATVDATTEEEVKKKSALALGTSTTSATAAVRLTSRKSWQIQFGSRLERLILCEVAGTEVGSLPDGRHAHILNRIFDGLLASPSRATLAHLELGLLSKGLTFITLLPQMSRLEYLRLSINSTTHTFDDVKLLMGTIAASPLTSLRFNGGQISHPDLLSITMSQSELPHIRRFVLSSRGISPNISETLPHLFRQLPNLTEITDFVFRRGQFGISTLHLAAYLPRLESITLDVESMTSESLSPLESLTALRHIEFHGHALATPSEWNRLADMLPHLHSIALLSSHWDQSRSMQHTLRILVQAEKLSARLTRLSLVNTRFPKEDIPLLSQFPSLTQLELMNQAVNGQLASAFHLVNREDLIALFDDPNLVPSLDRLLIDHPSILVKSKYSDKKSFLFDRIKNRNATLYRSKR